MKQFAFIVMGPHYDPEKHQAHFDTGGDITHIYTARSFDEAKERVLQCAKDGVGAIELCGAFGEERANEYIALTGGNIAIGYVTHFPKQDAVFAAFFGGH